MANKQLVLSFETLAWQHFFFHISRHNFHTHYLLLRLENDFLKVEYNFRM